MVSQDTNGVKRNSVDTITNLKQFGYNKDPTTGYLSEFDIPANTGTISFAKEFNYILENPLNYSRTSNLPESPLEIETNGDDEDDEDVADYIPDSLKNFSSFRLTNGFHSLSQSINHISNSAANVALQFIQPSSPSSIDIHDSLLSTPRHVSTQDVSSSPYEEIISEEDDPLHVKEPKETFLPASHSPLSPVRTNLAKLRGSPIENKNDEILSAVNRMCTKLEELEDRVNILQQSITENSDKMEKSKQESNFIDAMAPSSFWALRADQFRQNVIQPIGNSRIVENSTRFVEAMRDRALLYRHQSRPSSWQLLIRLFNVNFALIHINL